MTNPGNHAQTIEFLEAHECFGLPREDVVLFSQGMLPSFGLDGKILLVDKHRLALAPDGHGGSLKALATSGALQDMASRGVEIISYFQVDNPLVKPFDPLFIGLHAKTGSEMSSKVAAKVDDLEPVGNLCLHQGRLTVIEYSNFAEELARATNPDGSRRFNLGNLAIHLLDVGFVDRTIARAFALPYHRAEKAVTWLDENGLQRPPSAPNAIKLETFVFDALPLAKNPLLLEIDRAEEFSPVKNRTGADSMESAIRDQVARAARWLEAAGVTVPRTPDGQPEVTIEMAPSYARDAADVKKSVTRPPTLHRGETIYIY
ncbi:MAG: UDPGP type 1 family protein, partial [bacterium]|nr:UDPGP type 1 family protein [bacterium]